MVYLTYEDFLCCVQTKVQQELGEEVRVLLHRIPKNNGILLDGLSIQEGEQGISPTIYLNDFYRDFQKGTEIPGLVEQILDIYQESRIEGKSTRIFTGSMKMYVIESPVSW